MFLALKIEYFQRVKFDIFLIFAQNIDCVLAEAVLTSIHILRFGAKIKIGIPLHTPVLLNKSGVQWGIHYTDMMQNLI